MRLLNKIKGSKLKSGPTWSSVVFPEEEFSFLSSVFKLVVSVGLVVPEAASFSVDSLLLELATTYGRAWWDLWELLLPFRLGPDSCSFDVPWGITIFRGGTLRSDFPSSTSASLVLAGFGLPTGLFLSGAPKQNQSLIFILYIICRNWFFSS